MPSLKEYNVKIQSLKNTAKVTKTMNMVSTAKYRKMGNYQEASKEYAVYLNKLLDKLLSSSFEHDFFAESDSTKVLYVVLSSDRGLCGGFNNNLFKFLNNKLKEEEQEVDFITVSKKSFNFFKNSGKVIKSYEGITADPKFASAAEIGNLIQQKFLDKEYKSIYLVYNVFESALSQKPNLKQILPLKIEAEESVSNDCIYQPSQEELIMSLLPQIINSNIYLAFLENAVGEHAARMTAMDNATNNAKNLIEETTIKRNRARQAKITTELTEIVAGAESLK